MELFTMYIFACNILLFNSSVYQNHHEYQILNYTAQGSCMCKGKTGSNVNIVWDIDYKKWPLFFSPPIYLCPLQCDFAKVESVSSLLGFGLAL